MPASNIVFLPTSFTFHYSSAISASQAIRSLCCYKTQRSVRRWYIAGSSHQERRSSCLSLRLLLLLLLLLRLPPLPIPNPSARVSESLTNSENSLEEKRAFMLSLALEKKHVMHPSFTANASAREVLLWKDKKGAIVSLVTATVIWGLIEGAEYHFVTLVCHLLMLLMFLILISSRISALTHSSMRIPRINLSEEAFLSAASAVRVEINRWLALLYDVSSGKDFKNFCTVLASLWLLSVVASGCSFLTLCYIVFVAAHTVPVICERYGDAIDRGTHKASMELKQQLRRFDRGVLSKIPRGPVKSHKAKKRR